MSETLSNSNGYIQTAIDENGGEDKPMLQVKMNGNDDQGINALINRQLQGKFKIDSHIQSNFTSSKFVIPFSLMSYLYCPQKTH